MRSDRDQNTLLQPFYVPLTSRLNAVNIMAVMEEEMEYERQLRSGRRARASALELIYIAACVLDAAILVAWGVHHLWLFSQSPFDSSLEGYLRDGVCLLALGVCALLCYSLAHYRDRTLHAQMALTNRRMSARLHKIERNLLHASPVLSRRFKRKIEIERAHVPVSHGPEATRSFALAPSRACWTTSFGGV